jgi:hypothetical protein
MAGVLSEQPEEHAMNRLSHTAIIAGMTLGLSGLAAQAQPVRKYHRTPQYETNHPAPPVINDTRGNAALGGNNANSMSGPNSAGDNANGRTSGGGGMGGG